MNGEMSKQNDIDNHELFAKLDNLNDSSDDEQRQPKIGAKKILVKKKITETLNHPESESPRPSSSYKNLDSIRESLSHADRLREIQDENGRLRKVLAEKEYEIRYLKRKLDDEAPLLLPASTGDAAASKIVELAKKVRELNAQLDTERIKNKQLSKANADLETHGRDSNEAAEMTDESGSIQKENKELKEKFNQVSHKMMEFKSQCEILKQDLKKTQKVRE